MYCSDRDTLHTKLVDDQATIEKIVMEIYPDRKKKELDKVEIYTLNGKRICNMADHWPWTWVMTRGEDLDVGGDVFILASETARKKILSYEMPPSFGGGPMDVVSKKAEAAIVALTNVKIGMMREEVWTSKIKNFTPTQAVINMEGCTIKNPGEHQKKRNLFGQGKASGDPFPFAFSNQVNAKVNKKTAVRDKDLARAEHEYAQ